MIGSHRRHALAALLLLAACGDDAGSSRGADVADTTAASGDSDAAVEAVVTPACPFSGGWNLQNVLCGDDDITADWFRVIDRTVATITPLTNGCSILSANETDGCKEEETATIIPVANQEDTWRVTSSGITKCTPQACTFGGQDAACAIGDRASTHDAVITLAGGKLSLTATVGICAQLGAGTSTTMVFEPR